MTTHPAPMVPAEVDLRDFGFMPLDVRTLLTSSLWIKAKRDPRVAHAAVSLWCECWHQVPAASLPDDDEVLAELARCDAKEWARIKDRALLHFVACSDGRLYHRHVAKKALESWDAKQAQRARTKAATEAKRKRAASANRDDQRDDARNGQRDDHRDGDRDVHQGTGTGTVKGISPVVPDGDAHAGEPPGNPEPAAVRPEVAIAIALRKAGIEANAHHPRLLALVQAGATVGEFLAFTDKAKLVDNAWPYLLGCVEGERKRAAATAGQLHQGAMPTAQATTPGESTEAYLARMEAEREAERKRLAGAGPSPEVKAKLAELAGGMRTR